MLIVAQIILYIVAAAWMDYYHVPLWSRIGIILIVTVANSLNR